MSLWLNSEPKMVKNQVLDKIRTFLTPQTRFTKMTLDIFMFNKHTVVMKTTS